MTFTITLKNTCRFSNMMGDVYLLINLLHASCPHLSFSSDVTTQDFHAVRQSKAASHFNHFPSFSPLALSFARARVGVVCPVAFESEGKC